MKKNQRTLTEILNTLDLDSFKKAYCEELLSIKKLCQHFDICSSTVKKIVEYLNLSRDNHAVKSKSNSIVKNALYKNIKNRISKEYLYEYYIEQDNGYYDTIKHLNITEWCFDKLLKDYNIKKDRSKSFEKGKTKRIELYGLDNLTNWKKGQETRIENSGSLETSYKKGYEKQVETMLQKYGVSCTFLLDEVNGKKKHSKPNEQFARLLDINHIEYQREFILDTFSYDFKINNNLVEINPTITHNVNFNPFDKKNNYTGIDKNYHKRKTELAKKYGYNCINVWSWDDLNKIVSLLKDRVTIYARKCIIKELSLKEAKAFIDSNHIQGYVRSSIKLGLYYNDELVSVMTFGKPRFNKNYQYELLRYCATANIIGGAEKLFKYFVDNYTPNSIISYCDNAKFSGKIYSKLNFTLISKGTPTRHWCNLKNEHYLDSTIRQKGFSRIINHCEPEEDNLDTDDNYVLMRRANFLEVFDCGQSVYIWRKNN